MVSYDDFVKLELRAGRVLECSRVENSAKLLRMLVDIGTEKRQIIAGIGKWRTPEDMVDKTVIIIANLEYRKLAGLESQGMLLAAGDEDPALLSVDKETLPGEKVG
jgi:methionyl-tRNA synthetase